MCVRVHWGWGWGGAGSGRVFNFAMYHSQHFSTARSRASGTLPMLADGPETG